MNLNNKIENKGNILLVDDIPENLQLLSELLINLGYTVRSVTSGRMALKTVRVKTPDVILLDIKMPEMDGYEVCQTLKADPDLCDIPVIFISALDEAFDKVKAFESGGVDYITKPFHIQEVLARLENQLTIQRQKHTLKGEISKHQETSEILHQSRSLLSSVLNSSLDGIAGMQAIRDPMTGTIEDFRCLVVNPIISKVLGRKREDLIGKLVVKKFLNSIDPQIFDHFVAVVETGESLADDFYYPLEESFWYHYVAVKLGDGFAITIRDITARKQTELALQEANHQLQEANHKLELLANLDGLTQIANRRRFDDYLTLEWQRHQREKNPLSLILIDIDYFKLYNDSYGHQGGDDCLIRVAQAIAQTMKRPTDLVARYGGEEFAIILPNTHSEGALTIADSIREAIANLAIPHQNSEVSNHLTLSMGIASKIPTGEEGLEILMFQADKALYTAKSQGRNRVIAY
jgi:two-component system, cell cycle response regulator